MSKLVNQKRLSFVVLLGSLALGACVAMVGLFIQYGSNNSEKEAEFEAREIVIQLAGFSDLNGSLPPSIIRDGEGNPLYSWRFAACSVSLGDPVQVGFYDQSVPKSPDVAWNDPLVRRYVDGPHRDYSGGPVSFMDETREDHSAKYSAITGQGTAFDDAEMRAINDLPDDLILFIETSNPGHHWMKPGADLDVERIILQDNKIATDITIGRETGVFIVAFADATVWTLNDQIPLECLTCFFTIESASKFDRDAVLKKYRR